MINTLTLRGKTNAYSLHTLAHLALPSQTNPRAYTAPPNKFEHLAGTVRWYIHR